MKKLFLITALLSLLAAPVMAMDVTLQWDANTESDLAGYRVYYGNASGAYLQPKGSGVDVPLAIDEEPDPTFVVYTVTGLSETETYYLVVTAYDTEGLESGYSNEVSVSWDGVTGIPPSDPSGLKPVSIVIVRPDGTTVTITIP